MIKAPKGLRSILLIWIDSICRTAFRLGKHWPRQRKPTARRMWRQNPTRDDKFHERQSIGKIAIPAAALPARPGLDDQSQLSRTLSIHLESVRDRSPGRRASARSV